MGKVSFDFRGRVALVTGGSTGIGREAALEFGKSGAKVIVSGKNIDSGGKVAHEIQENGGEATFIQCDVREPGEIQDLVDQSVKKYGRLDIACNNAGIEGEVKNTTDCSIENWDNVINTNLKGVWLCMKYQIPEFLKGGGGSVVNISSIAGLIGFPGLPAYVASKHGVAGLSKTAALEFAEKNIRVNAICPGPIMTPMLKRIMDSTPGFTEKIIAGVPENRIGEPGEVAETILFLSSDKASYITGQCLAVDGGWVAQ